MNRVNLIAKLMTAHASKGFVFLFSLGDVQHEDPEIQVWLNGEQTNVSIQCCGNESYLVNRQTGSVEDGDWTLHHLMLIDKWSSNTIEELVELMPDWVEPVDAG